MFKHISPIFTNIHKKHKKSNYLFYKSAFMKINEKDITKIVNVKFVRTSIHVQYVVKNTYTLKDKILLSFVLKNVNKNTTIIRKSILVKMLYTDCLKLVRNQQILKRM